MPVPFAIKPRQTVLFTGDSITDCGRRGASAPLGEGYVRMAHDLMLARYPKHNLKVINTGIGGHTVSDLAGRWHDDVIRHQPHWLSIKIGINDLHRFLNNVPNAAIPPELFAQLYDQILERTRKETKAQVVLVEPFYLSTDFDSGNHRSKVLALLPSYLKVVHAMARKYKTRLVRTHSMFQAQLKSRSPDSFCPEPVHPNATGHQLIAHEWLNAVGW